MPLLNTNFVNKELPVYFRGQDWALNHYKTHLISILFHISKPRSLKIISFLKIICHKGERDWGQKKAKKYVPYIIFERPPSEKCTAM